MVTWKVTFSGVPRTRNLPQSRKLEPTYYGNKTEKKTSKITLRCSGEFLRETDAELKGKKESEVPPAGPDTFRLHSSL